MSEPDFLHRTRDSYDAIAAAYTQQYYDELDGMAVDRGLLGALAEQVVAAGGGPVLDVGCGPGRTTAYLDSLGLTVRGLDLSAQMVALARERHPALSFEVGSMTDLPVPAQSLGGLLAYYSLIHIPTPQVPAVLAGFAEALRPGAPLALAFQVGREVREFREGFGEQVHLDFHRRTPEQLAELLAGAGLELTSTTVQQPDAAQRTPHAFLLARRPVQGGDAAPY